jgi:hypothetical protein
MAAAEATPSTHGVRHPPAVLVAAAAWVVVSGPASVLRARGLNGAFTAPVRDTSTRLHNPQPIVPHAEKCALGTHSHRRCPCAWQLEHLT